MFCNALSTFMFKSIVYQFSKWPTEHRLTFVGCCSAYKAEKRASREARRGGGGAGGAGEARGERRAGPAPAVAAPLDAHHARRYNDMAPK